MDATISERVGSFQIRGTDEQQAKMFGALAKARGEFKPVVKDKTVRVRSKSGAAYDFTYATLESMFSSTVPALSAHGLAVIQPLFDNGQDGRAVLATIILHEAGGRIEARWSFFMPSGGMQDLGSVITYLKRYAYGAALNICGEDDDDANIADGNQFEVAKKPEEKREARDASRMATIEKAREPAKPAFDVEKYRKQAYAVTRDLIEELHGNSPSNDDCHAIMKEVLAQKLSKKSSTELDEDGWKVFINELRKHSRPEMATGEV